MSKRRLFVKIKGPDLAKFGKNVIFARLMASGSVLKDMAHQTPAAVKVGSRMILRN